LQVKRARVLSAHHLPELYDLPSYVNQSSFSPFESSVPDRHRFASFERQAARNTKM